MLLCSPEEIALCPVPAESSDDDSVEEQGEWVGLWHVLPSGRRSHFVSSRVLPRTKLDGDQGTPWDPACQHYT